MMRPLALLLVLFRACGAQAKIGSAWLDGYGPLEEQVGLPSALHHSGTYSARGADPSLLSAVRSHPREWVVMRAAEEQLYPPSGCSVTLVNSVQRHGARYPTPNLQGNIRSTVAKLREALSPIPDDRLADPSLGFLRNLTEPGGVGDLVPYGALQGYYSGLFDREVYGDLSAQKPFVRASGNYGNQSEVPSDRVLWTARWWLQGFGEKPFPKGFMSGPEKVRSMVPLPEVDVVVSELPGVNNTLDPLTCPAYSQQWHSRAAKQYGQNTVEAIVGTRLQERLRPAQISLTASEVESLMALCSFTSFTTANVTDGTLELDVSPVCGIFTEDEWRIVDYYYSLHFYYGAAGGNPYHRGAYQGYLRELYARLANTAPVLEPVTTINTTTLANGGFPLPGEGNISVYADFTHDTNMAGLGQAFGLFAGPALPSGPGAEKQYKGGFAASRLLPYQTKHAWEKIACVGDGQEYVRVRINEAVQPVDKAWCPLEPGEVEGARAKLVSKGLCPLPAVLRNLAWANGAGEWGKCFE